MIIPALNEEPSIGHVLSAIPSWVDRVIVADNGSGDATAQVAQAHGADVVYEPRRGYGSACLKAMSVLDEPHVVVFLDGDFSDSPEEMGDLVDPVLEGRFDMVIGSRVLGAREPGALTPQARFGNWLSCLLIRLFWGIRFTDLGPFRAIGYPALKSLRMSDPDYGWTVEMQIKAARNGLRVTETPVSYRKRIGRSKVSGTLRGVIGAGVKILSTIFLAALDRDRTDAGGSEPNRLIVFTRYPEPGTTKTRLIAALGPEGAAAVQREMAEHVAARASRLFLGEPLSTETRFAGGSEDRMKEWLGGDFRYRPQGEGDLGERLLRAVSDAFAEGARRVVVIGTDCPGVTVDILADAFRALHHADVTLGPAIDGGYYLIGVRSLNAALFQDMPWSTAQLLRTTLDRARSEGLTVRLLEPLSDVDRPEDLAVWEAEKARATGFPETGSTPRSDALPTVSVIIPALNEEEGLPATLERVTSEPDCEVIVVDGASEEGGAERARGLGAKVIRSRRGRGRQMNAGAGEARGRVLLFLHADTLLPDGWADHVTRTLSDPNVAAGAFELRLDEPVTASRTIERLVNIRSRLLNLPYGDQAIFVRAETFQRVGGFADIPIMEDFEFLPRVRKIGKIKIAAAAAVTSARRWKRLGVVGATAINQAIVAAYMMGISPAFIARIVRK